MKGKERKEFERAKQMEETVQRMREFSAKLASKRNELLILGREVAKLGDKGQISAVVNQYIVLDDYKRRVDKMLLNIKIAEKFKDIGRLTTEFFGSMTDMAKELDRLSSDKQLAGAAKSFQKTAELGEMQMMKSEDVIARTQETFASLQDMNYEITPKRDFTEGSREAEILGMFKGETPPARETADETIDETLMDISAILKLR